MRVRGSGDRVLATVLFTDIVGSTELAAELGDRRWRDLVARHHGVVRAQLKRYRGREIDTAGDGFFAAFDRPAQAIECALAIIRDLAPLKLAIRAGVHVGELETSGGKLGGIAVHTAARVVAAAAPGEILVTATVRELVAGSDIGFDDRGTTTLKGVPGEWRLFAVTPPATLAEAGGSPDEAGAARAGERSGTRMPRFAWPLVAGVAVVSLVLVAAAVTLPQVLKPPIVPGIDTVARVDAAGSGFDLAVAVGRRPVGLAAGDGGVWAINFGNGTVSRLDARTGQTGGPTAVGGTPTAIAHGAGAVWITTRYGLQTGEQGSVVRFSPRLDRQESVIDTGSGVAGIGYGEGSVWVAQPLHDAVVRIDPATNSVVREVPGGRAPEVVAVGHRSVWVASPLDGFVQRIGVDAYDVQARVQVSMPSVIAAGADAVWITSESTDTLTRLDAETNDRLEFEVGDSPRGVAVTRDAVWVALGTPGSLVRIDLATGEVERTLDVEGFADAVVADEHGRVWVSVREP